MKRSRRSYGLLLILLLVAAAVVAGVAYANRNGAFTGSQQAAQSQQAQASDDWTTYMHDGARSGFNAGEVRLSPDNAANLKLLWKQKLGGVIAAQPIVVSDTIYIGAWDGFFYSLKTSDGSVKWKVDTGLTKSKLCVPDSAGITSAADVTDEAVYVGGGDHYLYALNPNNGATLWKFDTGDNSETGGSYNWDSPLVFNGRVYYGTSAFCDRPFPNGRMWGVNAGTGKLEQEVHFVPSDQKGGGLWTSPTVDEATGNIFVTLGSGDYYIPYSYSMARLDPQTLAVVDSWQIPIDQQVFDGDWGTTPTLFKDKDGKLMVGAAAKNGRYYAFRADNLRAGPAWNVKISDGGECPQCGEGALSNSVYAYNTVYVAAGYFSLGTAQKFAGTVHALDPTTGAIKWIHPTTGSVLPAMAAANGLLVAVGGDAIEVLNAATGDVVWEYALGATTYAPPTIAGGVLYAASVDGYLYAFSAGPYPDKSKLQPYKVDHVGSNPPDFTPFRKPADLQPVPTAAPGAAVCFTQTNKCILPDFTQYWKDQGGLERFGPAETAPMVEAGHTVQYFRNAVLELRPKPDGSGNEVRMGSLDFHLFYYTPEDAHFDPAGPQPGATFFNETHHNLAEPFLSYWQQHGQVAGLGYPVSEVLDQYNPVDGETRTVQYFERARLELVKGADGKEQVALGALGLHKYLQRYGKLP